MNVDETNKQPIVLVVDDDEVIRELLSLRLGGLGYTVHTASDGMSALNLCLQSRYDIVICDVRMPKLSGISFLRNYRQRLPSSDTRIIMMSSLNDTSIRTDAASYGATFLDKPISMSALQRALSQS